MSKMRRVRKECDVRTYVLGVITMNLSKKSLKSITYFKYKSYDYPVDWNELYHKTAYHYSNTKYVYRW